MNHRDVRSGVRWMGAVDWDRRLFDSLIPLPDGTSYNAYLIDGTDKVALLDTVDPPMVDELLAQLADVPRIDYIVSHHAEQDHSGSIGHVLEKYPEAKVVVTPRAKDMLIDHLAIPEEAFLVVEDGEQLALGGKTLTFIHTPWVHWPETMVTYLQEERILFSCDFFGSHIATSDLYVTDEGRVKEAAKRYFAEIMAPFRPQIEKNLKKLESYDIEMIAPSHGQIYDRPEFIIDLYKEWVSAPPQNLVVIPYVSMHGSTEKMVQHLAAALVNKGVRVGVQSGRHRHRQTGHGVAGRGYGGSGNVHRAGGPAPTGRLCHAPGQRSQAQSPLPIHRRLLRLGRQGSGDTGRNDPQPQGRGSHSRSLQGPTPRGRPESAG